MHRPFQLPPNCHIISKSSVSLLLSDALLLKFELKFAIQLQLQQPAHFCSLSSSLSYFLAVNFANCASPYPSNPITLEKLQFEFAASFVEKCSASSTATIVTNPASNLMLLMWETFTIHRAERSTAWMFSSLPRMSIIASDYCCMRAS